MSSTPKFQPGDELIAILAEFEQNLVSSGLANQPLQHHQQPQMDSENLLHSHLRRPRFDCKKLKTSSTFDVPSKGITTTPPSIESDRKHQLPHLQTSIPPGNEILSALKQISTDVLKGNAATNQNLLNAVNSLQWIRVTNSLLGSGEPEVLSNSKTSSKPRRPFT